MSEEKITLIFNETEAVQAALTRAQRGDLVLIFADDVPGVWDQIAASTKWRVKGESRTASTSRSRWRRVSASCRG
jgi:hypothetical protein